MGGSEVSLEFGREPCQGTPGPLLWAHLGSESICYTTFLLFIIINADLVCLSAHQTHWVLGIMGNYFNILRLGSSPLKYGGSTYTTISHPMVSRPSWTDAIYFLQSANNIKHNTWGVNIFMVAGLQSKGGVSKMVHTTIRELFLQCKNYFSSAAKNCTATATCNYEQKQLHCKESNTTINHFVATNTPNPRKREPDMKSAPFF